jgi:colicin import membrane protein
MHAPTAPSDSTTVDDDHGDLVPMRTGFDVVMRGYDRGQVQHFVHTVEADNHLLSTDRDAALSQVESLARQLADARSEINHLKAALDRLCRTPVDPTGLPDRLRRMTQLANADAHNTTRRAQAAADHLRRTSEDTATRLRERHDQQLRDLHARRQAMEAEHADLMRSARDEIERAEQSAAEHRQELDAQAAEQRDQARAALETELAQRQAEADAELAATRGDIGNLSSVREHVGTRLAAAGDEVAKILQALETDVSDTEPSESRDMSSAVHPTPAMSTTS